MDTKQRINSMIFLSEILERINVLENSTKYEPTEKECKREYKYAFMIGHLQGVSVSTIEWIRHYVKKILEILDIDLEDLEDLEDLIYREKEEYFTKIVIEVEKELKIVREPFPHNMMFSDSFEHENFDLDLPEEDLKEEIKEAIKTWLETIDD